MHPLGDIGGVVNKCRVSQAAEKLVSVVSGQLWVESDPHRAEPHGRMKKYDQLGAVRKARGESIANLKAVALKALCNTVDRPFERTIGKGSIAIDQRERIGRGRTSEGQAAANGLIAKGQRNIMGQYRTLR